MANKYSGTQTEKNLEAAFAGESQARNKYTYFASVAKKEGFEQMAAIFLQTAENEKEHAKLWFKELAGIGDTAENCVYIGMRYFRKFFGGRTAQYKMYHHGKSRVVELIFLRRVFQFAEADLALIRSQNIRHSIDS